MLSAVNYVKEANVQWTQAEFVSEQIFETISSFLIHFSTLFSFPSVAFQPLYSRFFKVSM
jgi:hypothetical protein